MDVSIIVSGGCHSFLSWEVYVEVPLSKNFGISTFDLSAFQQLFYRYVHMTKILGQNPQSTGE